MQKKIILIGKDMVAYSKKQSHGMVPSSARLPISRELIKKYRAAQFQLNKRGIKINRKLKLAIVMRKIIIGLFIM